MLYLVGKNDAINSLSDLNAFLRENIGDGKVQLTEESANKYLQEMLKDDNYIEILQYGADKIEEWPM